jgi:two-component system sensor histidine kinase and response regulator WspE
VSEDLSAFALIDLFRTEAESQTALLSEGLLALERGDRAPATLESLMRAAHSVKGAARIVGIDSAAAVAHVIEDYFVAAQRGQLTVAPHHIDVLLGSVDLLNQIAHLSPEEAGPWNAENQPVIAAFASRLKEIVAGNDPPPPGRAPAAQVVVVPAPSEPPAGPQSETAKPPVDAQGAAAPTKPERVVRVTADSLTRLLGLAGETLVESRQFRPLIGALQQVKKEQDTLWESFRLLEQHLDKEQNGAQVVLHDLLGRAKERTGRCQVMLTDQIRELDDFAHRSEDLAGRLHHEIVASRMRPLADGVRGFPRMVRDLARQLGKDVHFEILGEDVGVDRDVLEKLEAPLNHLIRNALDHGLEMPEERAAGKPATGQITLEACHRAGMLQLTLRDDGRGIDPEGIRSKVVERGLSSAAMAEQLTQAELLEFLFLPGFSTKQKVTELSGRGVGLDVVQNMVKALGGSVRVSSVPGSETSFTLRLPITRSVVRALLVQIGGEPYALPLHRIERIEMVAANRIEWLEGRQYFTLDDQTIGLVEAAQILELPAGNVPGQTELAVVVIGDRGHFFGLITEKFLGERDLDVRPLDARLGKVQDLGGASVLEDGSPVLILDVEDLLGSIDGLLTGRRLKWHVGGQKEAAPPRAVRRILVVDDSITVRELERQMLQNHGYAVDIAVDGMDGWNTLRSGSYDLVVSDVDMPRMDGIELVKRIKQDPRLKAIPVVIVSYKDREEDRMRGLDAGANYYLTKSSFHDQTLLRAVADLIGEARS